MDIEYRVSPRILPYKTDKPMGHYSEYSDFVHFLSVGSNQSINLPVGTSWVYTVNPDVWLY